MISVNEKNTKSLTYGELRFLLAHECAHILKNHSVTTAMWKLAEKTLKGERNENEVEVELLKFVLALLSKDKLSPDALTLRNQEYEADEVAVRIMGDQQSAISCLTKLVNGDMNAPSHGWELFGKQLPAMNMGQRIEELRKRTGIFFSSFPSI